MIVVLAYFSALEYWRLIGSALGAHAHKPWHKKLPASSPGAYALRRSGAWGLSLPLHIMLSDPGSMRPSQAVKPHGFSKPFPKGSFVLAADGLVVPSPEHCFFQMANKLSLVKLIELGYELCGSYTMPADDSLTGQKWDASRASYGHPPLTSVKDLKAFVDQTKGMRGYKKAKRALRYIVEGSASPRETISVMILTLPQKLGGFGLPKPQLNYKIMPGKHGFSSGRSHYKCDLFWVGDKLDAEYESNEHHSGSDQIASDSRRRADLMMLGIKVITVTNPQLQDASQFEQIAKLVAKSLGKKQTYKHPGFAQAHRELRRQLLGNRH